MKTLPPANRPVPDVLPPLSDVGHSLLSWLMEAIAGDDYYKYTPVLPSKHTITPAKVHKLEKQVS